MSSTHIAEQRAEKEFPQAYAEWHNLLVLLTRHGIEGRLADSTRNVLCYEARNSQGVLSWALDVDSALKGLAIVDLNLKSLKNGNIRTNVSYTEGEEGRRKKIDWRFLYQHPTPSEQELNLSDEAAVRAKMKTAQDPGGGWLTQFLNPDRGPRSPKEYSIDLTTEEGRRLFEQVLICFQIALH